MVYLTTLSTTEIIELFHQPTLMHNFLYSLTTCLLHYYPRHVSSINMPIFRRKNCIHTASGIFALCKRLHSTLVENGMLLTNKENCALKLVDEIILYYDARSKKHQKTTSCVISVRPNGTIRLPLDGFSRKFIFEYFSKIYRENANLIKIWQE